jgi:lipoprotein signal peptidase
LYRTPAVRHTMIAVWIFAACSTVALHSSGLWFDNPVALAGLGCALGSAAGNLYDIVRHRYVLDFINLGWWPVFNLADVGIVGGLALALWR